MATIKGNVEIQLGAIAHVERGLWHAATEKLDEAVDGVRQMEGAENRIEYEAGWTRLVDSLEEFWARLYDEGSSTFTSFQPWAGAVDATRKADPLLAYLYQARHQSQHGRIALEWEPGMIQIGGGEFCGTIGDLQIYPNGSFEADVNPISSFAAEFKLVYAPGKVRLPTVINKKFKQTFDPPSAHLNKPIMDTSPTGIGWLAIEFYTNVLRQAFEKFKKASKTSG
jgi:hypothetical protein